MPTIKPIPRNGDCFATRTEPVISRARRRVAFVAQEKRQLRIVLVVMPADRADRRRGVRAIDTRHKQVVTTCMVEEPTGSAGSASSTPVGAEDRSHQAVQRQVDDEVDEPGLVARYSTVVQRRSWGRVAMRLRQPLRPTEPQNLALRREEMRPGGTQKCPPHVLQTSGRSRPSAGARGTPNSRLAGARPQRSRYVGPVSELCATAGQGRRERATWCRTQRQPQRLRRAGESAGARRGCLRRPASRVVAARRTSRRRRPRRRR